MMKFGLLTAILDGWTFEEVVDIASDMGFKCLEVACWPAGPQVRQSAAMPASATSIASGSAWTTPTPLM